VIIFRHVVAPVHPFPKVHINLSTLCCHKVVENIPQIFKPWEWFTFWESSRSAQEVGSGEGVSQQAAVEAHRQPKRQLEAGDALLTSKRSLRLPGKAMKAFPIKHTFIHYDDDDFSPREAALSRSRSAPEILGLLGSMREQASSEAMEQAHKAGTCKPCAYFHQKEDGCRWGFECEFCHVCLPGEIKKRKREKVKAMKAIKNSGRSSKAAISSKNP